MSSRYLTSGVGKLLFAVFLLSNTSHSSLASVKKCTSKHATHAAFHSLAKDVFGKKFKFLPNPDKPFDKVGPTIICDVTQEFGEHSEKFEGRRYVSFSLAFKCRANPLGAGLLQAVGIFQDLGLLRVVGHCDHQNYLGKPLFELSRFDLFSSDATPVATFRNSLLLNAAENRLLAINDFN